METFPSQIPKVSRKVGIRIEDPVERTPFDNGRARQRQRFEAIPTGFDVEWLLTDDEFNIFEAFVRIKLNGGADWFTIQLPATQGIQTVTARFIKGEYRARSKGVLNWVVSAKLETENNYGLDEAALDALIT